MHPTSRQAEFGMEYSIEGTHIGKRWGKEWKDLRSYWKELGALPVPDLHERKVVYGPGLRQYAVIQEVPDPIPNLKVLFFHGGAWTFGHPERFRHHGHFFVQRHLDCVLPSVRRLPFHYGKHIRADILTLLQLLDRTFSNETKWIIGGASSGGHLAAVTATDPTILEEAGWNSQRLAGLILIAPPLAIGQMPKPVQLAMERTLPPPNQALLNPMAHVHNHLELPVFIAHGKMDEIVKSQAVLPWAQRRQEQSPHNTTWLHLDGKGHMDLVRWSFPGNILEPELEKWLMKQWSISQ